MPTQLPHVTDGEIGPREGEGTAQSPPAPELCSFLLGLIQGQVRAGTLVVTCSGQWPRPALGTSARSGQQLGSPLTPEPVAWSEPNTDAR